MSVAGRFFIPVLVLALWVAGVTTARGETETAQPPESADSDRKLSVTHHSYRGPGGPFEYTATAGYLRLKDESEKPRADFFFTAYTADGQQAGGRPITFAFNGGPGASSAWLHMGVAGPARVITGEENPPAPPPYAAVENPYSWLTWTDLVFIDPVGTGFSRAVSPGDAKQFYNTREDVRSVGEFIRLYISTYGRWPSPKCIAGESYGAMRAGALLRYLYESHGMEIDGLILISPALDLKVIQPDSVNDLPYVLFLPAYTAAAWHHKKIAPDLQGSFQSTLAEAEKWAVEEYMPALARGDLLSNQEKSRIASQLSRFTGLPETFVRNKNLRVSRPEFTAELLRTEGLSLGIMDGRTIRSGKGGGLNFLNDPGMAMTFGPYTGAINEYLANILKFAPGTPYITFSEDVNGQWNWGATYSGQVDAMDSIRKALNRNRRLKIFAASGYFDLDIPYFATTYTISHLGVDPDLRANIAVRFFNGGHMFYTSSEALEEFTREISRFFERFPEAGGPMRAAATTVIPAEAGIQRSRHVLGRGLNGD